MEIKRGIVKIEWVELGEGLCGEYDPEDPEDIELLRFDVSKLVNGNWEEIPDASYCTLMPANSSEMLKTKALIFLMEEIWEEADSGNPIKKLCERLSWIEPSWINKK